ncbi:hypothetical protein KCU81_g781, partial [Aureobasidium melanogenum]
MVDEQLTWGCCKREARRRWPGVFSDEAGAEGTNDEYQSLSIMSTETGLAGVDSGASAHGSGRSGRRSKGLVKLARNRVFGGPLLVFRPAMT